MITLYRTGRVYTSLTQKGSIVFMQLSKNWQVFTFRLRTYNCMKKERKHDRVFILQTNIEIITSKITISMFYTI